MRNWSGIWSERGCVEDYEVLNCSISRDLESKTGVKGRRIENYMERNMCTDIN